MHTRWIFYAAVFSLCCASAPTKAADSYIASPIVLSGNFESVFAWNVAAGKDYKFNGLLLVDARHPGGPGFDLRFTTRATLAHFVANSDRWFSRLDIGKTIRIEPAYLVDFREITVAFEGTMHVTSNGTLNLRLACDPAPATCTVKAGSIMALEEIRSR